MNKFSDRVFIQTDQSFQNSHFEKLYLASRKSENRIYTDQQLSLLPDIETSHVHYREWQTRKRSASRLLSYLERKRRPLSILEMGCGNGWLSALLADIDNATVTGMDLNQMELQQARRVFGAKKNLVFEEGSINNIDRHQKKDIIIFAAAIQYFPSFDDTIIKAFSLLKKDGEIHLLDSHFYKAGELENAIERTRFYFQSLGHPEMAGHYFHHTVASLRGFRHRILFQPGSLKNKILGNKDPFPWICIYDK